MSWMVTRYGFGIHSGTAFKRDVEQVRLQLPEKQAETELRQPAVLGRFERSGLEIGGKTGEFRNRPAPS